MRFCYADESGHGAETIVLVGAIVDSMRMHRTKSDWQELIDALNILVRESDDSKSRRLPELKGSELYRGNAAWRKIDGGIRTRIIEFVINWMHERKHKVTFGAVSKARLHSNRELFDLGGFQNASQWCVAAMHLILGIQKQHQGEKKNKGHTVLVFDNIEVAGRKELLNYVVDMPDALGNFYNRRVGTLPLDQVVDVPFFADSKHVGLIQVSDLFAYILRLYSEINEGLTKEKFVGERDRLNEWIRLIEPVLTPTYSRWTKHPKDSCTRFLREIAPPPLLSV